MSYMPGGAARGLADLLEDSAECEELDLPKGEFVAKMGKAYKIALSIAAFVSLAIGIPSTFVWNEDVGIIFFVLGIGALLVLPSIISYRCTVNKIFLKEEYFLLLFITKSKAIGSKILIK